MDTPWQTCSAQLEQELTPQQFSAWIKPLAPLDYEEGRLRIAAPNRFKLDWVKTQFAGRITTLASQFWEMPVEVQFVLDPRTGGARKAAPSMAASVAEAAPASGDALKVPDRMSKVIEDATPQQKQNHNKPKQTNESKKTGKTKQQTRAAAIQVANIPGSSYN